MRREDIPSLLEKYGPYQRRLFVLMSFPLIMRGFQSMMVIVTFASPDHRCKIPELPNDTFAIQGDFHQAMVNRSIPLTTSGGEESYSQCRLYTDRNKTRNHTGSDETEDCQAWVYDHSEFDNTIATQFDLVCGQKGFRANYNMMHMVGQLLGSPLSGYFCDRLGRRKVFFFCFVASIVVGVASTFPVLPEILLPYRFLTGAFGMAFFLALYVLSLEFMGPTQRNFAGSMMMSIWLLGTYLAAAISYLVSDWRYLQIIGSAPFVLCFGYLWLVPESPRWLLSKGRVQEATAVVMKVVKLNKLTLPPNTDGKAEEKEENKQEGEENGEKADDNEKDDKDKRDKDKDDLQLPQESPLKLLKYPNLMARSGVIFFNWAVVAMTYYGLSLNVSNLAGSVRVNFLLSSTVEMLGYAAAWFLLDRLGRKRLHCGAMILAGAACLASIFSVSFGGTELQWATTALAMVGKFGISAAFSSIYLVSAELFPTVMRNFGMGCSSTLARVGSAVSPYIADLSLHVEGSFGPALPMVIFGAMAMAAGLLSLFLPETLHRKLPDTILEAANFTKKQSNEMIDMVEVKQPKDKTNQQENC